MADTPLSAGADAPKTSGDDISGLIDTRCTGSLAALQGTYNSIDLNRILAVDPGSMTGLSNRKRKRPFVKLIMDAREHLGYRPAFVRRLSVACWELNFGTVLAT